MIRAKFFRPGCALTALLIGMAATPSVYAAEFPATLAWSDRVALSLPVSGQIKEVYVRAGQQVSAGAPLLSLDARRLDARVSEARAGVNALERQRAEAGREAKRADELYARTVLSNVELERAHIAQQRVDGEYQQARARLQLAETERSYSPLKAPFDARILEVKVSAGESISATMQAPVLIELAHADSMDAVAVLKADELRELRLDSRVELEVNGQRNEAKVVALESPREGGYRVVVRAPMREAWLAGMTAKIVTP